MIIRLCDNLMLADKSSNTLSWEMRLRIAIDAAQGLYSLEMCNGPNSAVSKQCRFNFLVKHKQYNITKNLLACQSINACTQFSDNL